jgi:CRISPR-associated endoribonuclease Cas6
MQINYKILKFTTEAETQINLPDFKGSAFRGGFGNVFRKITCVLKRFDCIECPLKNRCIYAYVFETVGNSEAEIFNMHKYEKIPHPFIFEPPDEKKNKFLPGEKIHFNVILIGNAISYAPYFVLTIKELGRTGIGRGRGEFNLLSVMPTEEKTVSLKNNEESASFLTLKVLTPIRIKYNRRLVDNLEFHILIRSIIRRLTLIYYFHCKKELPQINAKYLIEKAEKVRIVSNNTRWYDWERYSTRQETRMKLGGVVGEITYEGDITAFMPYLKAGEILHIGKGTSFGLGKYQIIKK